MLTQRYPAEQLRLASQADWRPYPTAMQRDAWEKLPSGLRESLLREGMVALDTPWKPLLATRFLEYARIGDRANYERENFERRNVLVTLALAECVEGQGRFIDQIVNGLWMICEETYWGLPAHVGMQRAGSGLPDAAEPTVDLFAAETAAALAYIQYLHGEALDAVSPLIRPRIAAEIDHRILTPNLERDDFRWMGFSEAKRPNNWNPWVNSNWLACLLFIEPDNDRRRRSVAKIMLSLDRFIDPYPADGGCDEGPGYWQRAAASMFECLDLLYQATDGQINLFDEPLVQEMGRFIYRAHIADDYYVNFADASAVFQSEAALVYRYGKQINDRDMMAFGAWTAARNDAVPRSWGRPIESLMRWLPIIFYTEEIAQAEAYPPQPREVWLPVIEMMAARDHAGSSDGLYVAAKGGHNDESHNHNDIGEFLAFVDGRPLLVDAGVETYSRKTFSDQRYEIWTMQSAYHHLPTINGVQQAPGAHFAARDVAFEAGEAVTQFSLDIGGAYPPEAGVKHWRRTIRLRRGQAIEVVDDYALNHAPQSLTMSLLTPSEVSLATPGQIALTPAELPDGRQSAAGIVAYDAARFTPSVETIAITDQRMNGVWGQHLYRIVLTALSPTQEGLWILTVKP